MSYLATLARVLFESGDLPAVSAVEIEPGYEYAVRLRYHSGGVRLLHAADLGLNSGSSTAVLRDKAYTKYFLTVSGFTVPVGNVYLSKWWASRLDNPGDSSEFAPRRVGVELGFPVYVKPADGSQGVGVFRCTNTEELMSALETFEHTRTRVIVVEREVGYPDHRVVVLDDDIVAAYRREPPEILGDGFATVAELSAQAGIRASAFSAPPTMVLPINRHLRGHIANLSSGGRGVDLTGIMHPDWVELALRVRAEFGARYVGIDLVCADLTGPRSDEYAILEVSGAPGLNHFAEIGPAQERRVKKHYAQLLNLDPNTHGGR